MAAQPKLKPCPECLCTLEYWDEGRFVACTNPYCTFTVELDTNDEPEDF